MKTISRYIMTLALLLTAVTGAWAQSYEAKVFDVPASWTGDETYLSAADLPKDFVQITKDEANALAVPDGNVILIYGFEGDNVKVLLFMSGTLIDEDEAPWGRGMFEQYQTNSNAIICYTAPAEPKVAWNPATKTGSFVMPAYDVEIAPIYAPVAQWAKVDNVDQLPTAIEGIYAESTDAIVKAGTVAKIGETENEQGTLMYAVGTSATEQPALTAFSATLPTAKDITTAGDVYVWYYIKGADTPESQEATAENTFNDSEICTTPLKVTVLNNKFDIQFKAANDNTIQAGKATVTVGGAAATVTEGKLQGVKMGTEVKVKANTGYKFRKVEVKKGAGSLIVNPVVGQVIGSDGKNYAADATLTDGVTPVAMIAYVSGSHGLAIALADEGANLWVPWMYWDTAVTTAAAHTPAITGGTWKLPSQDEWKQMFSANGGNEDSYTGLNTALSTAGGNILTESGTYWSSSEVGENASKVYFNSGNTSWSQEGKNEAYSVRACLAF